MQHVSKVRWRQEKATFEKLSGILVWRSLSTPSFMTLEQPLRLVRVCSLLAFEVTCSTSSTG